SADSQVTTLLHDWTNPDKIPYFDGLDFSTFDYIFFPCHGGMNNHFYVFVIDFKKKQKVMLNSLDQRDEYETERCYHPTFRRLMEYA
ncbi:hypothetical protein LINGRAHAP2_LOCUS7607, partial [Linum grandiflorum]